MLEIPFQEEVSIKGFSVDFLLNTIEKTILEVYGPNHYSFEKEILNGKTFLREKVLKSFGYKVVSNGYNEF